jgi:hypothetical protein
MVRSNCLIISPGASRPARAIAVSRRAMAGRDVSWVSRVARYEPTASIRVRRIRAAV